MMFCRLADDEEHVKVSPTSTTASVLFRVRIVVSEVLVIATFPLKLPLFSTVLPLLHTPSENGIKLPALLSKNLHWRHNGSVSGTLMGLSLIMK